jgi:hypothetical protein
MRLTFFIALMIVCFPIASVWSATYYVSTEGDDKNPGTSPDMAWQTIAYAAKTAQAGDLVRIKGGDYGSETVVVENSGTPEAPIRFEGYDGDVRIEGSVKMVEGKAKLESQGIQIKGGSYIKLSGFMTLRYSTGIAVAKNSRHITVECCTAGICGRLGISIRGSNCEVRHCTAYNTGMTNIWVTGSDNVVADCWSYCHPGLIGILPGVDTGTDYCYASSDSRNIHFVRCRGDGRNRSGHGLEFTAGGGYMPCCENCRVTDCEMYNCWTLFGARHGSHGITFTNCYGESEVLKVEKGRNGEKWHTGELHSHGFYFRTGAHDCTVENCRIKGVRWGLDADEARGSRGKSGVTRNVTFRNCIAIDCVFGIQAAAPDTRVLNCLSARNRCGILIDNVKGVSVTGSIFCQNAVGIRGSEPTAQITRCNIWGNQEKLSGKGKEVSAGGNLYFTDEKELYEKEISLGVDCISKDPQFVDSRPRNPEWGDWHLKKTSPCKDMGPYANDPKRSVGMR